MKSLFEFSGVEASFNGASSFVYLDIATVQDRENGVESIVIGKSLAMTYQTSDFPGLKIGSHGIVNSKQYTIRDIILMDDGFISKAFLTEAP